MTKRSKVAICFVFVAIICISMLFDLSSYNDTFTLLEWIGTTAVIFAIGIALITPELLYFCLPTKALWSRWESTEPSLEQKKRMLRAIFNELTLIYTNKKFRYAIYAGKEGGQYTTTLNGCTCMDFLKRRAPCKHMYKLAIETEAWEPSDEIKSYVQNISQSNEEY